MGGAEVGEVVVGLLSEPGFGAAAENLGEADGHFGRRVKSEEGLDESCPYKENQATSRALGFFLAINKSFRAAWRGRRVPCSQLRTALGLTFK